MRRDRDAAGEPALPGPPPRFASAGPRPSLDAAGGAEPRKWKTWHTWATAVTAVIALLVIAGFVIQLPYYTVAPGDAIDLYPRVKVKGAKTYEPDGEMLLLFVRQEARVNVWQWIRASLDPDIDLYKEATYTGGRTPTEVRVEGDIEMALSQLAAKKVALEAAGYEVVVGDGALVLAAQPGEPADGVLERGDVLIEAGGQPIRRVADLSTALSQYEPGDAVAVRFLRDGRERTETIDLGAGDDGRPILGIFVAPEYDFPVEIEIDTSSIGGPSAGLAMTLSIVDKLTPGDLTGGLDVAVTGTIDDDGNVGPIGGISQKAVAARQEGADLFLVPACPDDDSSDAACEKDLDRAKDRAGGKLRVVPVATLEDALDALEEAGGDPVSISTRAAN